jgi:hypothetical protein
MERLLGMLQGSHFGQFHQISSPKQPKSYFCEATKNTNKLILPHQSIH